MITEANDFIKRMRNYQFIRPVDVHDDDEGQKENIEEENV